MKEPTESNQTNSSVNWLISVFDPRESFKPSKVSKVYGFICKKDIVLDEILLNIFVANAGIKECNFVVNDFKSLERNLLNLVGLEYNYKDNNIVRCFYPAEQMFILEYPCNEVGFYNTESEYKTILLGFFDDMPYAYIQLAASLATEQGWILSDDICNIKKESKEEKEENEKLEAFQRYIEKVNEDQKHKKEKQIAYESYLRRKNSRW